MRKYNINREFDIVVSTKGTMFGALPSEFKVFYAPTTNLANKTMVAGGMTETVSTIDTPHTAVLVANANYGSHFLDVASGHNIESGDTIEYATGKFSYVAKATDTRLYLKTVIRATVATDDVLTQVGNEGVYSTPLLAINTEGEYLITIESPEHGIIVESRVAIEDNTSTDAIDANAPIYSELVVAY